MTFNNPDQILLKPVITEKSLTQQANSKYHFWVGINASKNQIFAAFKTVFGVTPLAVNTIQLKGKKKAVGKNRILSKKSDRKRAIITLPKDTKIELLSLNTK